MWCPTRSEAWATALGHPFEFSWLEVSKADVFHPLLLSFYGSYFR
jgi:hypothetical protein